MGHGYVPIRIKDFISGTLAKSDIYICLPGSKYVKVLHKGQTFDPARLTSYEEHAIDTLFLKSDDFSQYVKETTRMGGEIVATSRVDGATCVRFLNRIADAVISELMLTDIRAESLENAKNITSNFVAGLQRQPNLLLVFKSLEELGEDFARHSIGVTLMATMMAMRLHWGSERTLQIIQGGGFLHDIGFRELPIELHDKPRAVMTKEELALYESHPYRGVKILESISSIPSEVISVIYDHHEVANGSGFPRNLKNDRIYPMARLISLADLFCHRVLSSSNNKTPMPALDVVRFMEKCHRHDYPNNFWEALNYLASQQAPEKAKDPA